MRNYIYILSISLIAVFSCKNQEADIFLNSPMVRLNEALKTNTALLQSSENGWAMEYFATSESPGYTLFVKFKTNGEAVFMAKNNLTKNLVLTDSSVYKTIGDNGPVLTFNTYNKVLHAFSNPVNPDGYGLEGDYEFVIMQSSADTIVLQGKKRATTILLTKIPITTSWSNYRASLENMNTALFANNAPQLSLQLTDKFTFANGASRVFVIKKENAQTSGSVSASFIVTRTGIRFHKVLELDGKKFQTFTLSPDSASLISNEDNSIKLKGPDSLAIFFSNNRNTWKINPDKMSPSLLTIYNQMKQSLITKYKATGIALLIRYNDVRKSHGLVIQFTSGKNKYEGNVDMNMTVNGMAQLSLLNKETGDMNGMSFYSNVAGYKTIADALSTTFNISTPMPLNPRSIKFEKMSDASLWFETTCY